MRHGHTADQQDTFIALRNGGYELLHHHGLCAVLSQHFNGGSQIQTVLLDSENACTAHAIQGFDNDVVVLRMEVFDVLGITRH